MPGYHYSERKPAMRTKKFPGHSCSEPSSLFRHSQKDSLVVRGNHQIIYILE